jgi:RNA 3'-terminal phosphate cyclase-like protein
VRFEKIRADADEPGLRDYEVSFLRLLDKLCNGARIDINFSGTTVTYRPGLIIGGKVRTTTRAGLGLG